ncbi:MAG: transposase [Acidimicrobiales bacterium]
MPKKFPPEFTRDVVTVARRGDLSLPEVAADFDISAVDDGIKACLTTTEQAEVVQLSRQNRRLEMENEILRRAAAYFARDHLPK